MKIGIFDPYLNDLGGGEKYMMSIAECLSRDNSVVVFWDRQEDLRKVAERFSLDISRIKLKKNIFSPQYSFFKRCLDSLSYDAIVILSDGSVPFVLSEKLFIHFQQPFPEIRPSLKTNLKKMRVNSFFCNSIFTKSFIDKEFKINSKVLYPPVNIKIEKSKKENIIFHVGRFRPRNVQSADYKKQEVMVEVFKRMVDESLKNWRFILAVGLAQSDMSKFNQLQKKAEGYPIEFMTNLNNDDLGKIYSESKIYWHASGFGEDLQKHPEFAEHFGISTVEAMGAGCVPVVFSAGGQREIIEDSKNGYLWNTLEDFISKTNNLIRDEKLRKEMSKNAIERSRIFSGDRFCKEVGNIIK